MSSSSEYRRPRRVAAISSSSVAESTHLDPNLTPKYVPTVTAGSNEGEPTSSLNGPSMLWLLNHVLAFPPESNVTDSNAALVGVSGTGSPARAPAILSAKEHSDRDSPTYLGLLRYITTYLIKHDDIISTTEAVAQATIPFAVNTHEHIGMGATFEVSSAPIPPGVILDRSWPRRLRLCPFDCSAIPDQLSGIDQRRIIVCKRPRIRLRGRGTVVSDVDTERLEAILLEIRALTHDPLLYHKNIVDFLGIAWDREVAAYDPTEWDSEDSDCPPSRVPVLLLEHARHGSLTDFSETEMYSQLLFEARASLCRDIAEGLTALHRCGIVHGDVKPDNILVFDAQDNDESRVQFGLRAKIGDFGFSVTEHTRETTFTLVGRTWPWNDPEWDRPRTWCQLQKTDVYSYGLVSWTILAKECLGHIFDIDFASVDMTDRGIRARVEDMKDWTLPFNAANYFAKRDALKRLLAEILFTISLERTVESRGTMMDVVELWRTWFTGLGHQKYHATPPGMSMKFTPIGKSQNAASKRQFQSIVRNAGLLPPSVKQQVVDTIGSPAGEDSWRGVTFRAFCYMTGWGVEQDLKGGKHFIDQASRFSPNSATFQTMFLEATEAGSKSKEESEYAVQVFTFLGIAQMHGSHEATHKLMQYFPVPCGYAKLRSRAYRGWKYGISSSPREPQDGEGNRMVQEEDIQSQFSIRAEIFSRAMHNELHFAVTMGYTEAVGAMLDCPDFDRSLLLLQDYNGDTPLLLAFRFGWYGIVQRLIDAGSDLYARNNCGEAAFHFLVEFDKPAEKGELAELLFALCGTELAACVCTKSSFPREPLWLLKEGDGTPLNRVVFRNDILLANIFMQHRVTPAPPDSVFDALNLAAALHSCEMLEIFWQFFPKLPAWADGELLVKACCTFRPQRMYLHGTRTYDNVGNSLDFLMDKMAMLSGKPLIVNGTPLLHFALHRSIDQEILQHIISRSTVEEINAYTEAADLSVTTIHLAIQTGSSALVESLLRKGGDALRPVLHSGLNYSVSTLQMCAGHQSSTNRILRQILDVHVKRSASIPTSALMSAVVNNNFPAAAVLIRAGVDINGLDDVGSTPLGVVLMQCTIDTVSHIRFLLEYPPSVGKAAAAFVVKPTIACTAFHMLAAMPERTPRYDRHTLLNITDYLLHKFNTSAQINARTKKTGYTALHLAAQDNPVVVRRLLECEVIDMTLQSERDRKTARQYNEVGLIRPVPKVVAQCGERAVKQYRRDQIEVRNLFAEKCGEQHTNWRSASKIGEAALGGGKVANLMLISTDEE